MSGLTAFTVAAPAVPSLAPAGRASPPSGIVAAGARRASANHGHGDAAAAERGPALGVAAVGVVAAVLASGRSRAPRGVRAAPRIALAATAEKTMTAVQVEAPVEAPVETEPVEEGEQKQGEKKGGWGLFRGRKSLEERLLTQLSDERQTTSRLRAERAINAAENANNIEQFTLRVEKAQEQEAKLLTRLREVQERKAALDEETARMAKEYSPEEGKRLAPIIREKNATIREMVEVVERLQREEDELTTQLSRFDENAEKIRADLRAAQAAREASLQRQG